MGNSLDNFEDLLGNLITQPLVELIGRDATAEEIAALLNLSRRHVDMLVTKGVLERAGPNRFNVQAAIHAYVGYAKKRNSALDDEKLRLTREQADKVELQNATARRDLVQAVEVEREWAGILRDIRAALLAVPSRIGSRLPTLSAHDVQIIDREIRDVLQELSDGNA